MTPEEQVKESGMKMALREAEILNSKLLAALEEAQKEAERQKDRKYLRMQERDDLGMTMALMEAELLSTKKELAEAQQTIARQREALTLIADMKIVGSVYVSIQAIARGELIRERQEGEMTDV